VSQATALCWHPERRLLVTGWENGEVHAWSEGHREFSAINGPHKAPIMLLAFSEMGGRMVTADSVCNKPSIKILIKFLINFSLLIL